MKFLLVALALIAASEGRFLDRSVKVAEGYEELFFGGFMDPKTFAVSPRIIGGSNAAAGEFPHQISMQVVQGGSRYHICGGSIISSTKIATAAHCCAGQSASSLRVVAGAHNMQVSETSQQIVSVSKITSHPSYNAITINNDACKLTLSTPLNFNARVATIPLCSSEPTSGSCTASGWGTTSTSGTVIPTQLQKINLSIVPRSTCSNNYAGINSITTSMLCAGNVEGQGGCNGDSGGPIICGSAGNKCLAGATSYGMQPCAQAKYPTVYANVANLNSFYSSN